MDTVRIFLASSIKEMSSERVSIADEVQSWNEEYIERHNVVLQLIECEQFDHALSLDGKQHVQKSRENKK